MVLYPPQKKEKRKTKKTADNNKKYQYTKFNKGAEQRDGNEIK